MKGPWQQRQPITGSPLKKTKTNKQNKTKQKNVADGSECPPIRKKTKTNLKQPTAAASARIIIKYFQIFRDLLRCWLHLHLSSCHGRCLIYRLSRLYNIVKQSFVIVLGESSDRSFVRSFRLINSAAHTHSHKDPSTRFSTIDLQYFACNLFVAFVSLFRFLFFFVVVYKMRFDEENSFAVIKYFLKKNPSISDFLIDSYGS